jgi:Fe-S cluster assembly protein SufD
LAETHYHPHVSTYLKTVSQTSYWTEEECAHALELAQKAPVPSRLEEDWRKTDPDAFPWNLIEEVNPSQTRTEAVLRGPNGDAPVEILPLSRGEADAERCRKMLLIAGDDYDAKFLYYHKALAQNPVGARIPQGYRDAPLEIVQRAHGPGLAAFTTLLVVERDANVVVYDRWELNDEHRPAIGRVEIHVEAGARLTYLQEDVPGVRSSLYRRARVVVDRDAELRWYAITPGAAWHVARLEVDLNGPGSYGEVKGLFAGQGDARADHRTHQYHGAPHAKSDLTFKTLLAGHAHSVYQGLITVPQQSQKTDAYQQCRNLLLESGTHADAIPKLEIIADDVRCTHGASMGSVNREAVFYLMSRGLTRPQAITAIATGFAEEIIRFVPIESVQERWRKVVSGTVSSALHKT